MEKSENFPMHVGIVVMNAVQLAGVYAYLGGAAAAPAASVSQVARNESQSRAIEVLDQAGRVNVVEETEQDAPVSDAGEVDTGGWAWSADLHASTRGKTKDGYWRMKVGVTRPTDKPGFPTNEGSIYTASTGETESSQSTDAVEPTVELSDDDEFAAFREAAAKADAVDAAAESAVPARKWTDADLGALCNQAAVKLGDSAPIKALIAEFVTEGEVAHSRNIADDKRAAFAEAVEAKAGITFAG